MHDADSWLPAGVRVYLEQKHGAFFPVIQVTRGDELKDVLLTLTLNEAANVADILTEMVGLGRHAALDTCEAEMKAS